MGQSIKSAQDQSQRHHPDDPAGTAAVLLLVHEAIYIFSTPQSPTLRCSAATAVAAISHIAGSTCYYSIVCALFHCL